MYSSKEDNKINSELYEFPLPFGVTLKQSLILIYILSSSLLFPGALFAQRIAAGGRHSLAICTDSTVQAWGYNGYGQLGNGNVIEQHTGTRVIGLTDIVQVAGGLFHSLFIKSDSTVWACGRNVQGPLGDGTYTDRYTPVRITDLNRIVQAAGGGEHSLFLRSDGTVWACGANSSGQLGDGTNLSKNSPVKVMGLTGITHVAAGAEFSLFLKSDGTVWACGHNGYGQFGSGSNTSSKVPVLVAALSGITQVTAGEWHSMFVRNDGTVFSSGRNQYGQLGDGTVIDKNTASLVPTLSDVLMAEAGGIHSVFVKNDGTVWSCGLNSGGNNDGQLGDGTTVDKHTPVQAIPTWGSGSVVYVEATREHSIFLRTDGVVWAAGRNNYGQLGNGAFTSLNSNTPVLSSAVCSALLTSVTTIETSPTLHNATLTVFNTCGIQVKQITNVSGQAVTFNRENLSSGLYFIRLTSDNRIIACEKLLITD